jgi:hypothetical protein
LTLHLARAAANIADAQIGARLAAVAIAVFAKYSGVNFHRSLSPKDNLT